MSVDIAIIQAKRHSIHKHKQNTSSYVHKWWHKHTRTYARKSLTTHLVSDIFPGVSVVC